MRQVRTSDHDQMFLVRGPSCCFDTRIDTANDFDLFTVSYRDLLRLFEIVCGERSVNIPVQLLRLCLRAGQWLCLLRRAAQLNFCRWRNIER